MRDACFPEGPRRIRGGGLPRSGTACILHGRLHAAVLLCYDGGCGQRLRPPDDLRPCLRKPPREGPPSHLRRGAFVFRVPFGPCYAEDGCFSKLGFPGPVACGGAFSMPPGMLVPAEQDRSWGTATPPPFPGHRAIRRSRGGWPCFRHERAMMDGTGIASSAGPPPFPRRGALSYHAPGVRARQASARAAAAPTMMCSPRPPVR